MPPEAKKQTNGVRSKNAEGSHAKISETWEYGSELEVIRHAYQPYSS